MADTNLKKATKLYDEIERNSLFISPIQKEDRSLMNVPFIFSGKGSDEDFLSFCDKRGLKTLKGHRSVGGFRASIYNAMPEAGIDALVQAMQDYESRWIVYNWVGSLFESSLTISLNVKPSFINNFIEASLSGEEIADILLMLSLFIASWITALDAS